MRGLLTRTFAATALLCAAAAPLSAEVAPAPQAIHPLLVGAEVPELTLTAADGSSFDLRAATGEQRSILVFYRGGW